MPTTNSMKPCTHIQCHANDAVTARLSMTNANPAQTTTTRELAANIEMSSKASACSNTGSANARRATKATGTHDGARRVLVQDVEGAAHEEALVKVKEHEELGVGDRALVVCGTAQRETKVSVIVLSRQSRLAEAASGSDEITHLYINPLCKGACSSPARH